MDVCAEVMTPNPVVVRVDTPLVECALEMARLGHRHLPIVDHNGHLAGVVRDIDVFSHGAVVGERTGWVVLDPDDRAENAGDVGAPAKVEASPEDPLLQVLERMVHQREDVAVVLDWQRHPVGIITEHDGLRLAQGMLSTVLTAWRAGSGRLVSVDPSVRASEAWLLMHREQIRHLVLVRDGLVAGVLSHRDLVCAAIPENTDPTVEELTAPRPLVVAPLQTPASELARVMVRLKIGCVPIVDPAGRAVSVVTRTDLLEGLIEALDRGA